MFVSPVLFYSICIMAFGVADNDGNITTNGIITGTVTLLMSLLLLGVAFRVRNCCSEL